MLAPVTQKKGPNGTANVESHRSWLCVCLQCSLSSSQPMPLWPPLVFDQWAQSQCMLRAMHLLFGLFDGLMFLFSRSLIWITCFFPTDLNPCFHRVWPFRSDKEVEDTTSGWTSLMAGASIGYAAAAVAAASKSRMALRAEKAQVARTPVSWQQFVWLTWFCWWVFMIFWHFVSGRTHTHTPSWPCRTCKLYIAYHSSPLQFVIASTPLSWCLPYEIKSQERSWNDLDFNIFQCMAGGLPNLYLPLVGCPCLGDSHRVFPWCD